LTQKCQAGLDVLADNNWMENERRAEHPAGQVGLTADRPRDHDCLTGFGDRSKLIADLTDALEPGRPRSIVAVFDLTGLGDFERLFGERDGRALIARLAEQVARVLQPTGGVCYWPRRDEFCVLISTPSENVKALLFAAEAAINKEGHLSLVTAWFGAAFLPDEAADPIEALMLADDRLRLRTDAEEPRERRQSLRLALSPVGPLLRQWDTPPSPA
jgi:GGDEF domain-containing protein